MRPLFGHGKEIHKIQDVEEGEGDLLRAELAQDVHQADQTTLWFEQIPNALDHLWQRLADRLSLGIPLSQSLELIAPRRDQLASALGHQLQEC